MGAGGAALPRCSWSCNQGCRNCTHRTLKTCRGAYLLGSNLHIRAKDAQTSKASCSCFIRPVPNDPTAYSDQRTSKGSVTVEYSREGVWKQYKFTRGGQSTRVSSVQRAAAALCGGAIGSANNRVSAVES